MDWRLFFLAALLAASVRADKLEDAAQLLIDRGLETWEKGDLPGARGSFASARELLPGKPNPYRLLALVDQKLGRCQDALHEADRFLELAPPADTRRAEVALIRESCTPPRSVTPSPAPRTSPIRAAAPKPKNRAWRIAGITSAVVGSVGLIVGVSLLVLETDKAYGAPFTAVGAVGVAGTIPFFVVDYQL